jgi:hypothetical protein
MSSSDAAPLPRREFARVLAAGFSGCVVGSAGMAAVDAQDQPAEPRPKPPSPSALVLAQLVTDCPSEHWNEETLGHLLAEVRADIARGKLLKSVPLTNADEPGPIFAAYRAPAGGR